MNASQEYARQIAKRYSVRLTSELLEEVRNLGTVGDIAAVILTQEKLDQWYKDDMERTNRYRAELGLLPFTEEDQPPLVSKRR